MAIAGSGEVAWVEEQDAFKHVGSADAAQLQGGPDRPPRHRRKVLETLDDRL